MDITKGTDFIADIILPDRVAITAYILDHEGYPASGVIVTATEKEFDQFVYSATSDANGIFTLWATDVPMTLRLSPPDSNTAITHVDLDSPHSAPSEFNLARGSEFSGSISWKDEPVSFSLVEILDDSGNGVGTTISDIQGWFGVRVDGQAQEYNH